MGKQKQKQTNKKKPTQDLYKAIAEKLREKMNRKTDTEYCLKYIAK